MGEVTNEIWIDKKIITVFDTMNQVEDWKYLFCDYQESTIISKVGNKSKFRLTTYPNEVGKIESWVLERTTYKENYTCEAVRCKPKFPFVFINVFEEYKVQNYGTLMRWVQRFETDAKSEFTEQQMGDYLNKKTKIEMQAIKEKIERGYY